MVDRPWVASAPPVEAAGGPGPSGLDERARRALAQRGLWSAGWQERLRAAPAELLDFLNRYAGAVGLEALLDGLWGYPFQRQAARAALRLAQRTGGQPVFALDLGPVEGGYLLPLADLLANGRRYHFRPWQRLDERAVRGQLARDMALLDGPERVCWVLDGGALGMEQEDAVRVLRELLRGADPRWLDGLPGMVLVSRPG